MLILFAGLFGLMLIPLLFLMAPFLIWTLPALAVVGAAAYVTHVAKVGHLSLVRSHTN